jgi:hypothetical protein
MKIKELKEKVMKWWKEYRVEPVRDMDEQEIKLRKILENEK